MGKQPETTSAAVWNPPRLRQLRLHGVESGTKPGGQSLYEGVQNHLPGQAPSDHNSPSTGYRMPTSSEPVPYPYPWQ